MLVLMVLPLVWLSVAAVGRPAHMYNPPRVATYASTSLSSPQVPSLEKLVKVSEKEHLEGQTHSHGGHALDMTNPSRPLAPAAGPAAPSAPSRGAATLKEDQAVCRGTSTVATPATNIIVGRSADVSDGDCLEGTDEKNSKDDCNKWYCANSRTLEGP
jgi:hypothetical protein